MATTQDIFSGAPARCYLHKLPGELRNKIYALALTYSNPIDIQIHHLKTKHLPPHSHTNTCEVPLPPLLRLSAAIKSEALSVYLASNRFRFVLESCFYCHGGLCTFDFTTFASDVHHLTQFEISTDHGIVFAIDITYGLGSRHVKWVLPDERLSSTTRRSRMKRDIRCDKDCARVAEVIDGTVAARGADALLEVAELEAIMRILI